MFELQLSHSNMKYISNIKTDTYSIQDFYFSEDFIKWVLDMELYIIYKFYYADAIKVFENIYDDRPDIGRVSSYTTKIIEYSRFHYKPILFSFNSEEDRNLFKLTWYS